MLKYGSNPLSAGQVNSIESFANNASFDSHPNLENNNGIFSKRNSRASKSRGTTNKTPIIQDRYGKKK